MILGMAALGNSLTESAGLRPPQPDLGGSPRLNRDENALANSAGSTPAHSHFYGAGFYQELAAPSVLPAGEYHPEPGKIRLSTESQESAQEIHPAVAGPLPSWPILKEAA